MPLFRMTSGDVWKHKVFYFLIKVERCPCQDYFFLYSSRSASMTFSS